MKVVGPILRCLPFIVLAQGSWIGKHLRKHESADDSQVVIKPDNPFIASSSGTCDKAADCLEGCFCLHSLCRHYGGVEDGRCKGKENGADLGDGGFCWDGRRDVYCAARNPNSNAKADIRVVPEGVVTEAPTSSKEKVTTAEPERPSSSDGEQSDDTLLEAQMQQAEKDTQRTMRKAGRMDPYEMFWEDVHMMMDYLMPGKRPNIWKKLTELTIVFFAIAWFIFYRYSIYVDDRSPKMTKRWKQVPKVLREDDPRIQVMKPDVVLVFHKPDFEYADKENEVPAPVLEGALVGRKGNLPRSEKMLDAAVHHHKKNSLASKMISMAASKSLKTAEDEEEDTTAIETQSTGVKMGEFRSALLQDICEHMPEKGFDVAAFTSVDDDELFICIGLSNVMTCKQHLQRYGMKLQLKQDTAEILGVDQDREEIESSPPYIRYDRRLAENVFGEGKTDLDVYQNFGKHTGNPVIISGIDRIRIIHQHLNQNLNLDYAVARGLLVQWYPAHNDVRVAELQQCWASWSLLTDVSVRQPLTKINEYYGSRVAFIFAWMGLYTKMLVCLAPVAILWTILNAVAFMVGKTDFWHRGSVMGISIVIIIWGKMANNCWKQEEEFFKNLWGLKDVDKDRSERPDFAGTLLPDHADANKLSLQYPSWKYSLRKTLSWVVTLLFCTLVFCCVVMWLDLFSGRMNLAASICQAIMIQVFTQIYNVMAEKLTLAENHKYQDDFYSSYLKKMFIFQLVNQYSAFFYMAVKQQFTPAGCPNDDCVGLIQQSLPVTLLVLSVMGFVQVLVGTLLVRFNLWYEAYQLKSAGKDEPVYSFVEEQAKYGQFRVREQIEVMTQLSLTLGYILIFGCVAPRIVPLCFLVFFFQLRASGILMTTVLKRTVPRISCGIGEWNDVFAALMFLGILFSAYLLVQFGPIFQGTFLITKMTGFFLYCALIGVMWIAVDIACPPTDCRSGILIDRRHAVENVVLQVHEDKNFQSGGPKSKAGKDDYHGNRFHTAELLKDAEAYVPKLIPAEGDAKHVSHNEGTKSARP